MIGGSMIERSPRTVLATLIGLALLFAALILIASAPAAYATHPLTAQATARPAKPPTRGRRISRGIVQAVSLRTVLLRQLDGSTLTVPVNARTRVRLDGRRATLADVRPGFVAIAVWTRIGRPAQELNVFRLPHRQGRAIRFPRR
jgi:hypothetical protein